MSSALCGNFWLPGEFTKLLNTVEAGICQKDSSEAPARLGFTIEYCSPIVRHFSQLIRYGSFVINFIILWLKMTNLNATLLELFMEYSEINKAIQLVNRLIWNKNY